MDPILKIRRYEGQTANPAAVFFGLCLCVLLVAYCTRTPTEPIFEQDIIVNAYLIVGHGIDSVFIGKSLPIQEAYSEAEAAISTVEISITVDGHAYDLTEYDDRSGAYFLPEDSLIVTPGKTYHLEVIADGRRVRASTTAPGQVRIQSLNTDTSYYPYPEPEKATRFEITWNPVDLAAAYEVSIISKTPVELVDFGMDQLVEHRLEAFDYDTLKAFWPTTDFPVGKNETSIEIPWFVFGYYGAYTLKLYAIDDNLWDLAASGVVYAPQSSEYEQPVYNVEGGIGIFSAVSVDSVHIHVKKQE